MQVPLTPKIDKDVFQKIFNEHWGLFKKEYPKYATDQYEIPVQKMLGCGNESGGYCEYRCVYCGLDVRRIAFSCKSCFCLSCSKLYTDEFVSQVSRKLHSGVVYRHIVLTIPEQLRPVFFEERHRGDLLSLFMRCGHECLESVVSTVLKKELKTGSIVVVQTHGRSGHYNPHLHIIMTSGGINEDVKCWFDLRYFKYQIIHKKWQYYLFKMLKSYFNTTKITQLINKLWGMYPSGLVANVSKGNVPGSYRGLARYLAKYVASPPIAIRRILSYDGQNVTYWYNDHETKSKKVETVSVFVFIGRMVQHIMPKGFQRIRYYGVQATKTFQKWSTIIKQGINALGRASKGTYQIVKTKRYREHYIEMSSQDPFQCRYCAHEMILWLIWHPKYGNLYDEYKRIKSRIYESLLEQWNSGGRGCSVRPPTDRVQLPLF